MRTCLDWNDGHHDQRGDAAGTNSEVPLLSCILPTEVDPKWASERLPASIFSFRYVYANACRSFDHTGLPVHLVMFWGCFVSSEQPGNAPDGCTLPREVTDNCVGLLAGSHM